MGWGDRVKSNSKSQTTKSDDTDLIMGSSSESALALIRNLFSNMLFMLEDKTRKLTSTSGVGVGVGKRWRIPTTMAATVAAAEKKDSKRHKRSASRSRPKSVLGYKKRAGNLVKKSLQDLNVSIGGREALQTVSVLVAAELVERTATKRQGGDRGARNLSILRKALLRNTLRDFGSNKDLKILPVVLVFLFSVGAGQQSAIAGLLEIAPYLINLNLPIEGTFSRPALKIFSYITKSLSVSLLHFLLSDSIGNDWKQTAIDGVIAEVLVHNKDKLFSAQQKQGGLAGGVPLTLLACYGLANGLRFKELLEYEGNLDETQKLITYVKSLLFESEAKAKYTKIDAQEISSVVAATPDSEFQVVTSSRLDDLLILATPSRLGGIATIAIFLLGTRWVLMKTPRLQFVTKKYSQQATKSVGELDEKQQQTADRLFKNPLFANKSKELALLQGTLKQEWEELAKKKQQFAETENKRNEELAKNKLSQHDLETKNKFLQDNLVQLQVEQWKVKDQLVDAQKKLEEATTLAASQGFKDSGFDLQHNALTLKIKSLEQEKEEKEEKISALISKTQHLQREVEKGEEEAAAMVKQMSFSNQNIGIETTQTTTKLQRDQDEGYRRVLSDEFDAKKKEIEALSLGINKKQQVLDGILGEIESLDSKFETKKNALQDVLDKLTQEQGEERKRSEQFLKKRILGQSAKLDLLHKEQTRVRGEMLIDEGEFITRKKQLQHDIQSEEQKLSELKKSHTKQIEAFKLEINMALETLLSLNTQVSARVSMVLRLGGGVIQILKGKTTTLTKGAGDDDGNDAARLEWISEYIAQAQASTGETIDRFSGQEAPGSAGKDLLDDLTELNRLGSELRKIQRNAEQNVRLLERKALAIQSIHEKEEEEEYKHQSLKQKTGELRKKHEAFQGRKSDEEESDEEESDEGESDEEVPQRPGYALFIAELTRNSIQVSEGVKQWLLFYSSIWEELDPETAKFAATILPQLSTKYPSSKDAPQWVHVLHELTGMAADTPLQFAKITKKLFLLSLFVVNEHFLKEVNSKDLLMYWTTKLFPGVGELEKVLQIIIATVFKSNQ